MSKGRGKARTSSVFMEACETTCKREQTKLSIFFFSVVWINASASSKTFYSDKVKEKKSGTDL